MTVSKTDLLNTKALVIAPPRSGFSLLLTILGEVWKMPYTSENPTQRALNILQHPLGEYLFHSIIKYFRKNYSNDEIIINQTFRSLLGGPMWLDDQDTSLTCVRKYIGIKNVGDLTLIINLPKRALYYHNIIHSHYHPKHWLEDPTFNGLLKFASIRNPMGTLYSSTHSINAITGEYINRFIGNENNLRACFAKYRLSDPEMTKGLITHLINYIEEFASVKDAYHLIQWEQIVTKPIESIIQIAHWRGREISQQDAKLIWKKIGYQNLTGKHQYNFRKSRASSSTDDWKYHLTNQHLDMFREAGAEKYMKEFGYGKIGTLDATQYTPFQKEISAAIDRGEIITNGLEDKNLQIFNWNKSNITKTSHDFQRYERKNFSQIERAYFSDQQILDGFSTYIDEIMTNINHIMEDIQNIFGHSEQLSWKEKCNNFTARYRDVLIQTETPGMNKLLDEKMRLIATLDNTITTNEA